MGWRGSDRNRHLRCRVQDAGTSSPAVSMAVTRSDLGLAGTSVIRLSIRPPWLEFHCQTMTPVNCLQSIAGQIRVTYDPEFEFCILKLSS